MLSIKLEGLLNERQTVRNKHDWEQWRALKLIDQDRGQQIAEWFYVVACSQDVYNMLNSSQNKVAYLPMDTYSEDRLEKFAETKFNKLSFSNWEDFYSKMSRDFVYDD